MKIYNENCIDGMKRLEADSVDLIVTDPPYGMSFMGKHWDKALPPIEAFEEMCRVLKPGAFAFVMCAPRSDLQARMSILLEDAGFDISFTPIYWTFATGFPKAQNISKQIDKRNGRNLTKWKEMGRYIKSKREENGYTLKQLNELFGYVAGCNWWENQNDSLVRVPKMKDWIKLKKLLKLDDKYNYLIEREEAEREVLEKKWRTPSNKPEFNTTWGFGAKTDGNYNITKDATPEAIKYNGAYAGFQPKPAVEVIIVAMKPRTEKTYVDQCLANGHGITYLDNCRIPGIVSNFIPAGKDTETGIYGNGLQGSKANGTHDKGRFPANLLVSDDSLNDGIDRKSTGGTGECGGQHGNTIRRNPFNYGDSGSYSRYFDLDAWFAIIPKPSKKEKNMGCEELEGTVRFAAKPESGKMMPTKTDKPHTIKGNHHPTVKPVKLMSYLITLGSTEGHVILDPFMGSGTTMIAAEMLNRQGIGFEMEEEYFTIAEARINGARKTRTVGQDQEDGCQDKTDEQQEPNGTGTGQTTLTSN